jgi:hypothetical protein
MPPGLLTGCDIEVLDDRQPCLSARSPPRPPVWWMPARVGGTMRRPDLIVSSDQSDLRAITAAVRHRLEIDHP